MRGFVLKSVGAFVVLILVLSLTASAFSAGKGSHGERRYPIPVVEAERVVTRWLLESGFHVSRSSSGAGAVWLHGTRGKEKWEVVLESWSALGASILFRCVADGCEKADRFDKLWTYLEEYLKSFRGEAIVQGEEVPAAVSSRHSSVACIQAEGANGPLRFAGFVIDRSGILISTAHDLAKVTEVMVTVQSGRPHKGRLIKVDPDRDLSLIRVEFPPDTSISLAGGRDSLTSGEKIYLVGCFADGRGTVRSGVVEGPVKEGKDLLLWQVKMEILPGSSGSPVFDVNGDLVGIVKGRYRGTSSVGFLISMDTVKEFLSK